MRGLRVFANAFPLRLRPGIGILLTSVKKLKKPCSSRDLGQGGRSVSSFSSS